MPIDDADCGLADSIIEQAADAVIFADVDGVIRRWNQAATEVFGFTASEALGQSLDLVVPERLRQAHWSAFHRANGSGVTRLGGRATITRARNKSGKPLYVDLSFAIVCSPAGRVAGSVAIARDVTRRYEEEKARRAAAGG
jgi:PAS domain S-box-containing protein